MSKLNFEPRDVLPKNAELTIQAYPAATDGEIRFGEPDWTVVAACGSGKDWATSSLVRLGVTRTALVDDKVRKDIANGEYADMAVCDRDGPTP